MTSSTGRVLAAALTLLALAACNGVQIKPMPDLPDPVVAPIAAKVGVVLPGDVRNYKHSEVRWGIKWEADLGPGHVRWAEELFGAEFREVEIFPSLEAARSASGLIAIFEPRIEQFSFTTARETGRYYAVTIRYRIGLYAPNGERSDTFTLTGYGNSLPRGASSTRPLDAATLAAMRDAAAKFLVQFPEQAVAKQIASGQPLVAAQLPSEGEGAGSPDDMIEAVPVEESGSPTAAESGEGESREEPREEPAPAPPTLPEPGPSQPPEDGSPEDGPPVPPPPVPSPPAPG